MFYELTPVSDNLIFIKWVKLRTEAAQPQSAFIDDLRRRLDESPISLYFLSDLRQGRITDVAILQRLGKLTAHPHYGAGTAFSEDVLGPIFVGVFSKFAERDKGDSVFYKNVEDALAYLESAHPGLTQGIDWNQVVGK